MGFLRYVYPFDNRKCPKDTILYLLGPYNDETAWFFISHETLVLQSKLTSQNNCKNRFTMGALRYACLSDNWKYPKISRKLYIVLNWLKDREIHLSITVIYTSRTKGNGLKWEFRSSFERDFQDFLRNLIYYNLHANRKESKENQLLH